jgi:hypothetical protein
MRTIKARGKKRDGKENFNYQAPCVLTKELVILIQLLSYYKLEILPVKILVNSVKSTPS